MLQKLFKSHFRRFLLQSSPWLIAAILGIVLALTSAYSGYKVWAHQPLMLIPENEVTKVAVATSGGILKTHTVEISGAISKPGIYEVSDGSRWQEVVLMADGFLESADKRYVHQKLNLAEKVKDQSKLYVPFASESAKLDTSSANAQSNGSHILFVNTATGEMWDEVEGIGEARVSSILSGVPYTDKNDFLSRSGVTPAVYIKIEEKYTEIVY